MLSLGAQMEFYESRYQKLLDYVHNLERQAATSDRNDDGTQEVWPHLQRLPLF